MSVRKKARLLMAVWLVGGMCLMLLAVFDRRFVIGVIVLFFTVVIWNGLLSCPNCGKTMFGTLRYWLLFGMIPKKCTRCGEPL